MAMMFAASYPTRVSALLLFGTFARFARADDYPHGHPPDAQQAGSRSRTPGATANCRARFAPSLVADATSMRALARLERMAMSPGTARKLFTLSTQLDVRHVLPAIRVPTLILHRTRRSAGACRPRPLSGRAHRQRKIRRAAPAKTTSRGRGDVDALLAEVREFLTGERADARARSRADDDPLLRHRRFDAAGGGARRQRVATTARGASTRSPTSKLKLFPRPPARHRRRRPVRVVRRPGARSALRRGAGARPCRRSACNCASACTPASAKSLGDKYSGIAVHVGARVAAAAEPGQVLVSSTVKDLVVGSGIQFDDLRPARAEGRAGRVAAVRGEFAA